MLGLNVPVNDFSVMSGRTNHFVRIKLLSMAQTYTDAKCHRMPILTRVPVTDGMSETDKGGSAARELINGQWQTLISAQLD